MNRFLQKVKEGASKASEKAQTVMEQNRVQSQIDSRLKEWKNNTYEIGCLALEAYKDRDMASLYSKMEELARTNVALEEEIDQLEWKRCELRNEKRCDCGQVSPWESNFCAHCGAKLPEPPKFINEMAVTTEETPDWEVQELKPYRHNESIMGNAAAGEAYPLNGNQKYHAPHNVDDPASNPNPAEQPNGREQGEETWTWKFPERDSRNIMNRNAEVQPDTLKLICPNCGAEAQQDAKWCERCGTPFI